MTRILIVVLCITIYTICSSFASEEAVVRKSPFAGTWYPGKKEQLKTEIEEYFNEAKLPEIKGRVIAIISPHAGIQYSGRAAAYGYKLIKGREIERVIIIGPSHYRAFKGIATSEVAFYETPLGRVKVDRAVSDDLFKNKLFQGPRRTELQEHCLEMQLPFLQIALHTFTIVPLIVGDLSINDYDAAVKILKPYIDDHTLVIASSDFTHFGLRFGYVPFRINVRDNLKALDMGAVEKILKKNLHGFLQYVDKTGITICGARPIGILLGLIPASSRGKLLNYYTSGDLTGDFSSSVSYASIVFTIK